MKKIILIFKSLILLLSVFFLTNCQQLTKKKPVEPATLNSNIRLTKIAFGSCSSQKGSHSFWKSITQKKPNLFIYAGDVVYGSGHGFDYLKRAFHQLGEINEFRKFWRHTPIIAIWDDHDYGIDDSGLEHPWKKDAAKLFLDFFQEPQESPRRQREGIYTSYHLGPKGQKVQIILLDTRYFRSLLKRTPKSAKGQERYVPDLSAQKTILGSQQWTWLERELKKSADLRLIVSSIQVASNIHGWEKWENIPKEKQRLLKLLKKTRTKNAILLSGDRHVAGIYKLKESTKRNPLYEITSSSLNRSTFTSDEWDSQLTHPSLIFDNNFGLVTINWEKRTVELSVEKINGETAAKQTVSF